MYQQPPAPPGPHPARATAGWRRVGPNVWALGVTSLVTDVASEMVTSVLPLYVVLHLHMSPLAFGALDGLYQGVAALVRTGSGVLGDRLRHHKLVAVAGYGLSAVAKLGYLTGSAWPALVATVTVDRLGKGVRTAPRDALIAEASPDDLRATAFGIHRAMDAAGAAIGPMVAFALLATAPGRFDRVFVTSFCCALVGVAAVWLLVDAPARRDALATTSRGVTSRALATPGFRGVLLAATVVSMASISDGLLYLVLQRQVGFSPSRLPLLFVATPLAYFLLAGPFGVLADRHGPRRMFLAGHGALAVLYALMFAGVPSVVGIGVGLVLLGSYYAATDGVLAAMASRALPADVRGTGLGLVATCTTAARGAAALAFGALWTYTRTEVALGIFLAVLLTAMAAAALWLRGAGAVVERGTTP